MALQQGASSDTSLEASLRVDSWFLISGISQPQRDSAGIDSAHSHREHLGKLPGNNWSPRGFSGRGQQTRFVETIATLAPP
jgi:hypothetical protein